MFPRMTIKAIFIWLTYYIYRIDNASEFSQKNLDRWAFCLDPKILPAVHFAHSRAAHSHLSFLDFVCNCSREAIISLSVKRSHVHMCTHTYSHTHTHTHRGMTSSTSAWPFDQIKGSRCHKRPNHISKETNECAKRDLFMCQKSPILYRKSPNKGPSKEPSG